MEQEQICENCGGSGWILYKDNEGRDIARECGCRQVMIASNRLKNSGIAEALKQKSFKTFDTKGNKELMVAKDKAIDYFTNFENIEHKEHNSAMFLGQVGCGKTHLSLAIANNLLQKKEVGVVYLPYRETMTTLKQLEKKDKYKYEAEMHKYLYARLLVIDDLFKGNIDSLENNYIFQIINTRYLNHLPFICSSEKSPHDLLNIDEGLASRMIEQARGHTIYFENDISLNHRITEE